MLCEADGRERASLSLIVRPDGYEIPENVAAIHGITTEIAERAGVPLLVAMTALTHLWGQATVLVAHNYEFDARILRIAIARLGRAPSNAWPAQVRCTMKLATPVVNLPPTEKMLAKGMNFPKRPSLQEAHTYLLGEPFEGAHGALADARAAARVFFKLKEMGHVS